MVYDLATWNDMTLFALKDWLWFYEVQFLCRSLQPVSPISLRDQQNDNGKTEYPHVSGALGASAAITAVMTSDWGRTQPRTEREITEALNVNAIYFSQGSISGTLNYLTKTNRLRRLPKDGLFAYTPTAEALVTA